MKTAPKSFPQTRWTLIERVRLGSAEERAAALDQLCQDYWFPLYAYARKIGIPQHESEDAVQSFMLDILSYDMFSRADQEVGHLRTMLLGAFTNQLKFLHRHENCIKRGGEFEHVRLPMADAEGRYQMEIASSISPPDVIYHRQWAENLVTRALQRVEDRFAQAGKPERFRVLRNHLPGNQALDDDADALSLGMTAGAFRTAVSRTRQLFLECLRDEVRQTIGTDDRDMIDNELRELLQTLSS